MRATRWRSAGGGLRVWRTSAGSKKRFQKVVPSLRCVHSDSVLTGACPAAECCLRREAAVSTCAARRLYEGGRVVNGAGGGRVRARARVGGERRSCLYRPVGSRGLGVIGGLVRRCMSIVSRQAARRKGAPAGAKGSLRVSMCQIASVSRRERSIWATLGPRWRPRRRLVCW
jgi:hypothetical protein